MSGGRYGRGKAPERACLPLRGWPDQDRRSWEAACAHTDLLEEDAGARAGHSTASNRKAEKGYGRWLTFLLGADPGCLNASPQNRITTDRVRAYVDSLIALQNSTATILARLQELGEAAKVMGPGANWRFINAVSSKIRAHHKPARDKANLRLSDELLDLGLRLIDRATKTEGIPAAILHRDGLMIALLALVPLRRRNMAGLRLDRNLIDVGDSWLIALDASETKTHAALEIMWPDELLDPFGIYLAVHRPLLVSLPGRWSKPIDNALWVSSDGSPMTEIAIYDRICKHTKEAFGAAINPHLFRDAAATTLAIEDPEHVRVAAPLLGHRTFTTTEKYYQQAKSLEAHHAYVEVLFGKKKGR
jgi:integrase/recombinase XerD